VRRAHGLVLLLALCPALLQGALGPRYGGEMRVGIVGPAPLLDPHAASGPAGRLLMALVHETLVRVGPDGVRPGLAESWSASVDGREWTLTLPARLRFHDGTELTSADAVRSLRRFLAGESPAGAELARRVDDVEARDGLHLTLRFRAPAASSGLLPLASLAAAVTSEKGAACGPFVAAGTSGDERVFVPFGEHVFGRPFLDRVRVRVLPDTRALIGARRLGQVDVAIGAPGSPYPAGVLVLVLDPRRPPFDSIGLRTLVATAVDRDTLARRTLTGAQPWARLLPEGGTAAASPVRASASPRVPPGTRIVLAVDPSLPPLASQRVVAHLAALGITAEVRTASPDSVRDAPADARLLIFEPELPDAWLGLQELGALVGGPSPGASEPGDAPGLERRLLSSATLVPLARLARTTEIAPTVHGLDIRGYTTRLEDTWTLP
jgi:ABC-type transport system substrate-binding protein